VPYGTIVPEKSDSVWVIGRCFSATHNAHASCRSMAQTMAMGQAAGLAAIISLQNDESASELNVVTLREKLIEKAAVLEVPNKIAFTEKDQWSLNF
jgi:hypothetical protein